MIHQILLFGDATVVIVDGTPRWNNAGTLEQSLHKQKSRFAHYSTVMLKPLYSFWFHFGKCSMVFFIDFVFYFSLRPPKILIYFTNPFLSSAKN
jgi:hypothetical protein